MSSSDISEEGIIQEAAEVIKEAAEVIKEAEIAAEAEVIEPAQPANENLIDLETYQRLKADFDNFRRRTETERLKRDDKAITDFVENLLPVLEAFEAGMEYDSETLKPVYTLFFSALVDAGLKVINPASGEVFNPTMHEAIEVSKNEESEPVVKEVVRTGYMWGEKLLRPAQVKVG